MTLELYTHPFSPASQKVRLALYEKELAWVRHDVDLPNKENIEPWYLKLNPMGVLPTLSHDGQNLAESSVIMEYLEDAFPTPSLRPETPAGLARMRWWMHLVDDRLHYSAGALVWSTLMRPAMLEKSEAEREALLARVPDRSRQARHRRWIEHGIDGPDFKDAVLTYRETFDRMNADLVEREWIAGDNFTLADCALVPYVQAMAQLGPSVKSAITDEVPATGLSAAAEAGAKVHDRIIARFANAA
jgi:glutathione S-transferase